MKVYLTEQSAKISLSEEEVQSLVEDKEVIGSPDTEFLSPFGKRIVIVAKETPEFDRWKMIHDIRNWQLDSFGRPHCRHQRTGEMITGVRCPDDILRRLRN